MVQQYLERKKEYPDCMLLFQVGDFYEFFGEDARRASLLLNLALTRKSKQSNALEDMCGFPVSSLDSYVEKLVMHHGVKVAICNQVESASSAKNRGYKALVDRQVVRIVTPGSLVEDAMLSPDENNYLAALYYVSDRQQWGIAWADLSTGEFVSTTATPDRLASTILRCSPKEILLPESLKHGTTTETSEMLTIIDTAIPANCMRTYRDDESFLLHKRTRGIHSALLAAAKDPEQLAEASAAAAILDYVDFTQQTATLRMRSPLHLESSDHMIIDASAWKALEIAKSLHGTKQASLLHCIDDTVTPAGSRLLSSHLASPLMNLELLEQRLDGVAYLVDHELLLKRLRKQLLQVFDVERSLQRLSAGVGTPKDLKNIATTIDEAQQLAQLLADHDDSLQGQRAVMPALLDQCREQLLHSNASQRSAVEAVAREILSALSEDVTSLNSKNGFVRAGYSPELDKWRAVATVDPGTSQKDLLQQKYRQLVGSTRLRVGYHAEKGYFIDIPHDENNKLMQQARDSGQASALEELTMIQSLKNAVRYRTKELRDLNRELLEASLEVTRLEHEIFDSLRDSVLAMVDDLRGVAGAIAQLDVTCSHAQIALDRNFTRPLLDNSREIHIENGRHAVVEAAHLQGKNSLGMRTFVPNSLHLSPASSEHGGSCWLLTGPNMGGKSTFLRQNAHLVVLAQIGSFVPASFARIGVVDKLFCRVGSADDLASDKSTFMVEMEETATILTQATARSLVLMDEVGRGTAVNDGIAIAGAVLETLCEKRVRSLFATHFTVLSDLIREEYRQDVQLYRMEVLERTTGRETAADLTQLVFSHRVVQGLAPHSYGIHTAALAGCPLHVVQRAAQLLEQLTSTSTTSHDHPDITLTKLSALVDSEEDAEAIVRRVRQLLLE
ncbi:hypothetical protein Poli38472_007706 [Pythium oligandrum]|uniref:DNA mismatch repair proteins mutS family domain-containing protein n=1 Tax=Pythium oligandrum TaxID=41045 RepID=A0A8K1CR24_PYTOL|nr:hypothetical protein Poli38472_007706 [Pythium oligandrum]|eukprot:TMW68034.1 hypothetical protein Poli38472_007706 [Pythium oligandrum]